MSSDIFEYQNQDVGAEKSHAKTQIMIFNIRVSIQHPHRVFPEENLDVAGQGATPLDHLAISNVNLTASGRYTFEIARC